VLPPDDLVAGEVGHVGDTDLASGLDEHPSDVSPPETLVGRVRVELGVGVAVVSAVAARPPLDRALDGARAGERETKLKRNRGVVRSVRPESVVTRGDAKTGDVVVDDTEWRKKETSAEFIGLCGDSRIGLTSKWQSWCCKGW
jgi:hypothetical protein